MSMHLARSFSVLVACAAAAGAAPQLTTLGSFNPSNSGGLCSGAVDPTTGNVWCYECFGANIEQYTPAGAFVSQVARPGESANDVDLEFTPDVIVLNSTALPAGTLLFINGESGFADIYAVDKSNGSVLASLTTAFGVGHVVGGGYHATRNTLFLVQDKVPGGTDANRVAEIDPTTGAVLQSWVTSGAGVLVNYGDLDISATGNVLIVSSDETSIAEFTPTGVLVQTHNLPSGVSSLSGIAATGANAEGWVAGTSGVMWHLGGLPTCGVTSYCTAGTTTNGCVASLSSTGNASATASSGFTLTASNVEGGKSGLFFYGISGQLASPWGASSSFLCVKAPTQRTPTQASGGTNGACDGSFSLDWNQFISANPTALGAPFSGGETVQAQAWFRDPPSPKTTHLSNGLQFTVCL